jgi:hypothetical protein
VNAQAAAAFIDKIADSSRPEPPDLAAEAAAALHPRGPHRAHAGQIRPAQRLPHQTRPSSRRPPPNPRRPLPIAAAPLVDLVERTESLEVELAATLLYSASHHPYRQIRDLVAGCPPPAFPRSSSWACAPRPPRRSPPRLPRRRRLRFDILMDIGGFRDMHRHRRCTQIIQPFTALHGYETPARRPAGPTSTSSPKPASSPTTAPPSTPPTPPAPNRRRPRPEAAQSALYLLPARHAHPRLFKMDFAEAQYISELRSGPAGHFSYRRVAWEMFLALQRQHPTLAKAHPRHRLHQPIDIFQR